MTINRNNAMATRTMLRVPPEPQGNYKSRHLAQQRACPVMRWCRTETFCGDTETSAVLGSRVPLPTALHTRQKTLRKQTGSLQRHERRMYATSRSSGAAIVAQRTMSSMFALVGVRVL